MTNTPIERRKYARFSVREGAFAVFPVEAAAPLIGRIVNISKTGLAFYYENGDKWSIISDTLGILPGTDNLYLEKIPFTTISDGSVFSEFTFRITETKRRGVKFGALDQVQVAQLDCFIKGLLRN